MDIPERRRLGWLRSGVLLALCSIGGIVVPSVNAEHIATIEQKNTLKGLKEMSLEVHLGFSREGPSRRQLRDDVKEDLKTLPIRLLPEPDSDSTKFPSFVIDVAVLKKGDNSYFFLSTARVYEQVTLDRDRNLSIPAVTWKIWNMGDGDFSRIREKVSELIRLFIIDYQAVNDVE